MRQSVLCVSCLFVLAACSPNTPSESAGETATAEDESPQGLMSEAADAPDCPAVNPRDASAYINKFPGPDATPALHINLTVDSPNQGDEYELVFRSADRMAPPAYMYDLVRTHTGMLTAISTVEIVHREPNFAEPELRAVKIRCTGFEGLEISPVEIVH